MNPLIETWHISHRMNDFLLKGIPDDHLADVAAGKGRSVAEQFAHIHNVRLMWLKAAMPELLEKQQKIEKEKAITRALLTAEMKKSGAAIGQLLEAGIQSGRIKGFKPHPEAFAGYLVAHESHHRGQIILTLKLNGHLPDKKTLFGLWEWGVAH